MRIALCDDEIVYTEGHPVCRGFRKTRIQVLREHGFSAGINILVTIGHHEEDFDESIQGGLLIYDEPSGENSSAVLTA